MPTCAHDDAQHCGQPDDAHHEATAGTRIIQWPSNAGANQRWWPEAIPGDPDGAVRLLAQNSGMVLDVFGASTADGAEVILWPRIGANGANNQHWDLGPLSSA